MDIDNAEINSSTAFTQSPGDNSTRVATTAYADAAVAAATHNALNGLQGGTTNEYYHLSSAQHTSVTSLSAAEYSQLANIDTTTISSTQWGYLGALNQSLATSDSPTFASLSTGTFSATGAATFTSGVSFFKDISVLLGFTASFSGSVSCTDDVTITAGSDATPALNIKRFSSSGTAQIDFQNESGTVYWETGMIAGGALSYYFYDGTGTPIQMVWAGNLIFNPAGSIVCSKAVSMSSTLGVTGATTLSSTLSAKTTLIQASNDTDSAIQIRRASATGKSQFTLENESGTVYWTQGLTGGGSTDYNISDGTQNVVTMEQNSDMTIAPGGNLILDGTRGSDTRYIQSYFSSAAVYNAAADGTEEQVVSGLRYYWYSDYWQTGVCRSGSTPVDQFVISKNGTEVLVMDTGTTSLTTTDLTLNGEFTLKAADCVTNFWGNSSVAEGVSIQTDYTAANTSGRIFYVENSNKLYGFSLLYNGGTSVFNGDSITTDGSNTFNIVRHDNSLAGTVSMSISRNGGVSINEDTTVTGKLIVDQNDADYGLHVKGGNTGTSLAYFERDVGSSESFAITAAGQDIFTSYYLNTAGTPWNIGVDASTAKLHIWYSTGQPSTTDPFIFTTSGLGINTDTPSAALEVRGVENAQLHVGKQVGGTEDNTYLNIWGGTNYCIIDCVNPTTSGAATAFAVNGTEKFRLMENGNIQHLGATATLAIQDSGTASATEAGWVTVTIGGSTMYLRAYATK